MELFRLPTNLCSIQSLQLPHIYYSQINASHAIVKVNRLFSVFCRPYLCDKSAQSKACFLNFSVILPSKYEEFNISHRKFNDDMISEDDIIRVNEVLTVEQMIVIVVMKDASSLKKIIKIKQILPKIVKELLKIFTFCEGCFIFLEDFPSVVTHGIFCIIIKEIKGEDRHAFNVNDKTNIVIHELCTLKTFQHISSLSDNLLIDKIINGSADQVVPLHQTIQLLENAINIGIKFQWTKSLVRPSRYILLVGQPSCGKSLIINAFARKHKFVVLKQPCGDLNSLTTSSALELLQRLFSDALIYAETNVLCLVVLKDIDLLSIKINEKKTRYSELIINEVTRLLDKVKDVLNIFVIGTSNLPENVDGSLRKVTAFNHEIEISILSEKDRENAMKLIVDAYQIPSTLYLIKFIAENTPGFVLGDLLSLIKEIMNGLRKEQYLCDAFLIKCYKEAIAKIIPTALKDSKLLISSCKTCYNDIGGLEDVKHKLKISIQWQVSHPEAFRRLGIPPTRGVLLYGPPGCAKTMLVKALACECKATFLAVSSADLYSPYVGESEKKLVKLFSQARMASPAVLFIDEIDALIGTKGGARERGVQERILATLLVELDGIGTSHLPTNSNSKLTEGDSAASSFVQINHQRVDNHGVIVVGATNRPDLIDEALKRPGRFDKLIYVPPPNEEERLSILQTVSKKMKLNKDVNLKELAIKTELFSGADLKALCTESALEALTTNGFNVESVSITDFNNALKSFKPSLTKDMIDFFTNLS